ncbi:Txe/YoeB family addiction module toxin [Rickettsia endosymbiont of Polydrusus tereticollis]|uniref:Txe/YoeB family addiction module toxin n=1 Tax=Rickettsia endosymbiont of Polydrusus tereticollis TaxID=3066251 RepID=UPI0031335623
MYSLYFTQEARKDYKLVNKSIYKIKIQKLLTLIENNPFQHPPPYKKLIAYSEAYSRRINLQHRLFYQVDEEGKRIKILRMWSHYGDN